jgi:hypothetical protein
MAKQKVGGSGSETRRFADARPEVCAAIPAAVVHLGQFMKR